MLRWRIMTDLILAILHHLAVVTLIGLLAIEFALLRAGAGRSNLAPPDAGGCGLWRGGRRGHRDRNLPGGLGRQGRDFYLANPWFWAKMASFAAIGILSIPPTIALLKWRKAGRLDPAFLPPDAAILRLRRFVHAEVALLALVLACAAAMARYAVSSRTSARSLHPASR